jgi:RNA polymerase sigma-70 factor, ECF subfamily
MPMPFRPTDLLAELPRLRRYARILTEDAERADRLVEETLHRARRIQGESVSESSRSTRLLALLRSVNAEQAAPSTRRETPLGAPFVGRSYSSADRGGSVGPSLPDRAAEMLAQLRELPLEQREVLVLVAVERMSYVDIAALLHMPVATVISRLSQAREALRKISPNPLSAPNNAG